jgi:hypothetical protein
MAPRKSKSATAAPKAREPGETAAARGPRRSAQPAAGGDPNRLLREAAWSRMFGRTEAKNPFTR